MCCVDYGSFGNKRAPKFIPCHYFFQEGGGSSLDQLYIISVVTIGLRREGGKHNLRDIIKYTVFYFEGAPKARLNVFVSVIILPSLETCGRHMA